jgi:predicted DNA-binding mobile mystery protein A
MKSGYDMNQITERGRKRLDARLVPLNDERNRLLVPPKGWIRAIRDALGMSGVQLGKRLKVSPQTVEAMEKSEAAGTIQLNTLKRAAEALDCTLVYALIPRSSLENTVKNRARQIANAALARVSHTMKLEDQDTGDEDLEARIEDYILHIKDRDLWNST